MKTLPALASLPVGLALILGACGPAATAPPPAELSEPPPPPTIQAPTAGPTPTETPVPVGQTLIVTNLEDSGDGSLRHALQVAQPGDIVKFDPGVFPVEAPGTIALLRPLDYLTQGHITIDASDAGVILDGRDVHGDFKSGIEIHSSNNVVRGLHVIHFPGPGLGISGGHDNLFEQNVVGENEHGMGLWGTTAMNNQFRGNFVGVEADGITPQGNAGAGLFAGEGSHGNLFGPGNVSAFNGGTGVEINGADSIENTVFENSIHDNGQMGIALNEGGNQNLTSPRLMDFDPGAGRVDGTACANCRVLIYSDAQDEGAAYEGEALADSNGTFAFDKGAAFAGPAVTATSIDESGNTSPFSIPASGTARAMQLQVGNAAPRLPIVTKPSDELEDNAIAGIWTNLWAVTFQEIIDEEIVPLGLKRVHMAINEIETVTNSATTRNIDWGKPELSIPPEMDVFVPELRSYGISVDYVLSFWDKANHPNGWEVYPRFKTEEEITRYLDFVRFVVSHYRGQVQSYELWNEPELQAPLQYIESSDYIRLANLAIPLIHEIDPQAKVVVGADVTANPRGRDYFFRILNSDLMPLADIVSWHPFFGEVPGTGQYPDYYAHYPELLDQIMQTAIDHGFRGQFKADEITFAGAGCDGCDVSGPFFSDVVGAKYTARMVLLHRGANVLTGVGGTNARDRIRFGTVQILTTVLAGASPEPFDVQVQTSVPSVKVFTFSRSDGSRLAAIWNDDPAVDEDPGVPSSVNIADFGDWSATGIDTINGFEQQLDAADEDGSLVIRDLLLKDYPTIIRLSK